MPVVQRDFFCCCSALNLFACAELIEAYSAALMTKEEDDKKTVVTDHTENSICEINKA